MWTLIITIIVTGMPGNHPKSAYVHYIPSGHSITVNNLSSQEVCEKTGMIHTAKIKASDYKVGYVIADYTCVEQKQGLR